MSSHEFDAALKANIEAAYIEAGSRPRRLNGLRTGARLGALSFLGLLGGFGIINNLEHGSFNPNIMNQFETALEVSALGGLAVGSLAYMYEQKAYRLHFENPSLPTPADIVDRQS